MAAVPANKLAPASPKQVQVAGGAGAAAFTDSAGGANAVSVQLKLHGNGHLAYKNRHGTLIELDDMGPGPEPIEAQSIETATTMLVTVYLE
jgi:hypothetical protein